jgi:hypothetical protein
MTVTNQNLIQEEIKRRWYSDNAYCHLVHCTEGDEVLGGWRKLCKVYLHNLYSLTSIIRMMQLRRMRCARDVA